MSLVHFVWFHNDTSSVSIEGTSTDSVTRVTTIATLAKPLLAKHPHHHILAHRPGVQIASPIMQLYILHEVNQ